MIVVEGEGWKAGQTKTRKRIFHTTVMGNNLIMSLERAAKFRMCHVSPML